MVTRYVWLDLSREGIQQTITGFYTGESGEKQICFRCRENDERYALADDCKVIFYAMKPDGTRIVSECTVENGEAYYTQNAQLTASAGQVMCQLQISAKEGTVLFVPQFMLTVEKSLAEDVLSRDDLTAMNLAIVYCHQHENQTFLDGLDETDFHSHANKEFLDGLNMTSFHDHMNKAFLDGLDETDFHSHENKALLDALTDSHFHTHDNLSTLGQLSEENGTLYFAGAPIGEAQLRIHRIGDDSSVIPPEPKGTLLYFVTGTDPDLLCYPMEQRTALDGTVYWYDPPWQAGQLWISSGLRWNLLARHAWTENMQQGTADTVGDSTDLSALVHALQKTAHTHANMDALEHIGQDTDDVVLLPMGEPLHLIARADFGSAPMYAMESFIRQNDPKYDFYVDGADGTRIRMVYNGVSVFDVEVNGNSSADLPESFTIASINGYASVETLPADMLEAYRTFCSFLNTSAEAMGSGVPIAGKAEIPTVGLLWNRTYAIRLDFDSIGIIFAEGADEGMIAQEAYTTAYVYFPQDIDAAISGVDYFIGDAPQTTQGWHKWIFCHLPNGQVSLGALDMEAIT